MKSITMQKPFEEIAQQIASYDRAFIGWLWHLYDHDQNRVGSTRCWP